MSTSRSQERRRRPSSSQQQAGESSADEITPMVSRERGGAPPKGYDTTTTSPPPSSEIAQKPGAEATAADAADAAAATTGGRAGRTDSKRRGSRSGRARRGGRQAGRPRQASGTADEEEEEEGTEVGGWWRDLVDKFGSVELENKGSVARDHLALGKQGGVTPVRRQVDPGIVILPILFPPSNHSGSRPRPRPAKPFQDDLCHTQESNEEKEPAHNPNTTNPLLPFPFFVLFLFIYSFQLTIPRTNLPRLAPHLAGLRLHRHRSDSALSAQHGHLPAGGQRARSIRVQGNPLEAFGKTARVDFLGRRDSRFGRGREEIF